MIELSSAGKLNLFWFIISLISVVLTLLETAGLWPLRLLPSVLNNFWAYLFIFFVVTNVVLRILYSEFTYATTVRSCLLGNIFASGLFILLFSRNPWKVVGRYLCVLSGFHFSEFLSIAWCNTSTLSVSSFILNHSREYWIALAASWIEFVLLVYLFPVSKTFMLVSWFGLTLCLIGEILRKTAMFTASTNFNHLVQVKKEDNHRLITHGIYSWCRHPSYVGWYLWSVGTQLLLMNPVCTVAYAIVSWVFFRDRIIVEEMFLLLFFKEEYSEYQKKVGTGLPFIDGLKNIPNTS